MRKAIVRVAVVLGCAALAAAGPAYANATGRAADAPVARFTGPRALR